MDDRALFQKLKIQTLLDLALTLPVSYDDTTLSTLLQAGKTHTLEATVQEAGYRNGKFHVRFYLPAFQTTLFSIFFRVTPYHLKRFVPGERLFIQGKLEMFRGAWQMPQPRIISEVGRIVPKYKTPLKAADMRALVSRRITRDALVAEGLTHKEAQHLLWLHFPDSLTRLFDADGYKPDIVQTLKRIEAYNYMRKLRQKRVRFPAKEALREPIEAFTARLPFTLSDEQKRVIAEVRADLARNDRAARRLVIGDVGSGKTMVILAAAVTAGRSRSLLMAPTSVLALQLYEEACKYLEGILDVALMTQNRSEGDIAQADFIIGTHALLYRDDLPDAALVMVDEQHRFGANQRHLLEKKIASGTKRPHYVQFSATPIPRTQAMMQSALIDVSIIRKPPFRKEIATHIIGDEDFGALLAHIQERIEAGEQTLVIYPLIENSEGVPYQSLEEGRVFWEKRFAGVFVTHGKDKEKEEVLLKFRQEGTVLLATTVVEVGISLPRLTTIVIVGAERLGLATLHQLRGRVGRLGQKSRCYLFTRQKNSKRLEAFAKTTDGFEIAKLDLRFRDSGDILDGRRQSGQKFRWLDPTEDEAIVAEAKQRVVQDAAVPHKSGWNVGAAVPHEIMWSE